MMQLLHTCTSFPVACTRVFIVLATICTPGLVDAGDVPSAVRTDWQTRRAGLRGAKIELKTQVTVKAGSKGPSRKDPNVRLPVTDHVYEELRTLWVDLESGRFRRDIRGQSFMRGGIDAFRPDYESQIFDGKSVGLETLHKENTSEIYTPSETQPELTLFTAGELRVMLTPDDIPALSALGICIPFWKRKEAASLLDDAVANPSYFSVSKGKSSDLLLRASGPRQGDFEEWRIPPDSLSAPASVRVFDVGKPWFVVDIEYGLTQDAAWPKSWTFNRLLDRQATDLTRRTVVLKVERNPQFPQDVFEIPLAGKRVIIKDQQLYRQGEDGVLQPFQFPRPGSRVEQSTVMPGGWLLIAAVVVAALLTGISSRSWFLGASRKQP